MSQAKSPDNSNPAELSLDERFESVIDEIPERFERFSRINPDETHLILVSEETRKNSSIFFGSQLKSTVESHGFTYTFTSRCSEGVGTQIWFRI
jgi:hypothetical protein